MRNGILLAIVLAATLLILLYGVLKTTSSPEEARRYIWLLLRAPFMALFSRDRRRIVYCTKRAHP